MEGDEGDEGDEGTTPLLEQTLKVSMAPRFDISRALRRVRRAWSLARTKVQTDDRLASEQLPVTTFHLAENCGVED